MREVAGFSLIKAFSPRLKYWDKCGSDDVVSIKFKIIAIATPNQAKPAKIIQRRC
jgi:hypothetical protein